MESFIKITVDKESKKVTREIRNLTHFEILGLIHQLKMQVEFDYLKGYMVPINSEELTTDNPQQTTDK